MNEKEFKQRFEAAVNKKNNWEYLYRKVLRFVKPERDSYEYQDIEGSRRIDPITVCDSTAINALNDFVSNLQSSLVPPMREWIKLVPSKDLIRRLPEDAIDIVNKNLELITKNLFTAIQTSNFDVQVAESFFDLGIGTGALMVNKGDSIDNPIDFVNIPLSELYIEEGKNKTIQSVFRKHRILLRNVKSMWPDMKNNHDLIKLIEGKPDEYNYFIEGTIPKKIKVKKLLIDEETGKSRNIIKTVDGFIYKVYHEATNTFIVEREQESSPWIIFRWSLAPGEVYGRGPAMQAIYDIQSLNATKELILRRASIAAAPPILVKEDGVMDPSQLSIEPFGVTQVMETGSATISPSIKMMELSGSFDVSQIVLNDLKASINKMMFAEPLGPINSPVKTATEISIRQQELSKRIGAAYGRLQYEFITPIINRILFLLNEWEILPTNNEAPLINGTQISIEYKTPLASAQEQENLQALQQFVVMCQQIVGPEASIGILKTDKILTHIATYLNIPIDVLPNYEEWEQIKQKVSQASEQIQNKMNEELDNTPE